MAAFSTKLICLITGLGFETVNALARSRRRPNGEACHVLLGSHDLAKGEKAAAAINNAISSAGGDGRAEAIQLDVTEASSIAAAAEVLADHGRLEVLVNNAGMLSQAGGVAAALRADLEINVLGAVAVTEALLLPSSDPRGRVTRDPRLVFVSSSMGSLNGAADPESRCYRSVLGTSPLKYRLSKAALNMLMLEYWKRYGAEQRMPRPTVLGGDTRVRVWAADPGANATDFMGEGVAEVARARGIQGPEDGAKVIVGCVVGKRDGEEGRVVGVYDVGPW